MPRFCHWNLGIIFNLLQQFSPSVTKGLLIPYGYCLEKVIKTFRYLQDTWQQTTGNIGEKTRWKNWEHKVLLSQFNSEVQMTWKLVKETILLKFPGYQNGTKYAWATCGINWKVRIRLPFTQNKIRYSIAHVGKLICQDWEPCRPIYSEECLLLQTEN